MRLEHLGGDCPSLHLFEQASHCLRAERATQPGWRSQGENTQSPTVCQLHIRIRGRQLPLAKLSGSSLAISGDLAVAASETRVKSPGGVQERSYFGLHLHHIRKYSSQCGYVHAAELRQNATGLAGELLDKHARNRTVEQTYGRPTDEYRKSGREFYPSPGESIRNASASAVQSQDPSCALSQYLRTSAKQCKKHKEALYTEEQSRGGASAS
jgi:hypothetical protein